MVVCPGCGERAALRGTQLSIVGTTTAILCRTCDPDEYAAAVADPMCRILMPTALANAPGDER